MVEFDMETICFVQFDTGIRVYSQAKALKKTGKYKLILICEKCNYDLFENIFDEIVFYGVIKNKNNNLLSRSCNYAFNKMFNYGEKRLKNIAKTIGVDIFHAHAEPNNIPRVVIENSSLPVVFDGQDFTGISSGIENLDARTREDEKYCFEHADGICHKGPPLEIEYYRQHGYKINCPEIQWLGGCDEELFADSNAKKVSDRDGKTRLVYAGSISPDPKYEYKYFIPLAKEIAKQKVHLHIYPSNPSEYKHSEYLELSQKEQYFHFHKHVPYNELSREISKYDWGILIEKNIRSERYIEEKPKVGMATKLFSYMEAGLPIIVGDHLLPIKEFVETNKIGFSVKDDEINKISELIKGYDYTEMKRNVLRSREIWSLRNQARYLEEFYQKVIEKTGVKNVPG
jgi:hypothetical protein